MPHYRDQARTFVGGELQGVRQTFGLCHGRPAPSRLNFPDHVGRIADRRSELCLSQVPRFSTTAQPLAQ